MIIENIIPPEQKMIDEEIFISILNITCLSETEKAMTVSSYSRPSFWHDKPEAWKEIMPGVKRRVLAHSTTGLMVLYKIESGKTFALHNHPHAQYGILLEGVGKFRVGDSIWDVRTGDTYFIPPGIFHELKTEKDCVVLDFFTPEREDYVKEAQDPDDK